MSMQQTGTIDRGLAAVGAVADHKRYLFGPFTDFLCLGGVSLIIVPITLLLPDDDASIAMMTVVALAIANVVNHPHFALSYQIFYQGFRTKAFGRGTDAQLRYRYIFAGVIVPIALFAVLLAGVLTKDIQLLAYAGNLFIFLIGWHYAKQGYGMLMVDATLKRLFFAEPEKRILLVNSYALWILTWLAGNAILEQRDMWGITVKMFHVPELVLTVAFCAASATTAMAAAMLIKKWRENGRSLPVNGVVAYIVTLYTWLLFGRINAYWLNIVPALHSLQYLVVVARFQLNRELDDPRALDPAAPGVLARLVKHRYQLGLGGFMLLGVILGYLGFWGAPDLLQATVPYDQALFGSTIFIFTFWLFINVHHYFLDNVMWRRQNPDVRKYLFV